MPALVLTSAPVASLQQLQALAAAQGVPAGEPLALATSSGGLAATTLSAGAYDTLLSVADRPGHHTVQLLGLAAAALQPGGRLVVQEVRGSCAQTAGFGCRRAGRVSCRTGGGRPATLCNPCCTLPPCPAAARHQH